MTPDNPSLALALDAVRQEALREPLALIRQLETNITDVAEESEYRRRKMVELQERIDAALAILEKPEAKSFSVAMGEHVDWAIVERAIKVLKQ